MRFITSLRALFGACGSSAFGLSEQQSDFIADLEKDLGEIVPMLDDLAEEVMHELSLGAGGFMSREDEEYADDLAKAVARLASVGTRINILRQVGAYGVDAQIDEDMHESFCTARDRLLEVYEAFFTGPRREMAVIVKMPQSWIARLAEMDGHERAVKPSEAFVPEVSCA